MVTDMELFDSPHLIPLDFYLWGLTKGEVYKRKLNTWDKLLASILGAAATRKDVKIDWKEQRAIFAHEVRSVHIWYDIYLSAIG